MTPYANFGGNSGIVAYSIEAVSIEILFKDRARYLYTYASAGENCVEQMKELATQGSGLNSYISRVVKKSYARKS